MSMTIFKLQNTDNCYFTEPILTEEDWIKVLYAADDGKHKRQLDVLRMFLSQPSHKGTCIKIGKEYSMSDSAINVLVQHFGKFAQNNCGKEFCIESNDDNNTFWPIAMLGRKLKDGYFEWELRPELVLALQHFLVNRMMEAYREPIISEGLNNHRSNELYKWQVIASAKGKSTEDIVRILVSKECNFVEKPHNGATIIALLESSPKEVVRVFDILLQKRPLNEKLRDFSVASKQITPAGKSSFGDERTAAAFLACVDPQQYTPYTSTIYETYCRYLGISMKTSGQKYSHFLELLQNLILIERQDDELQKALKHETGALLWSDILNAQDILWQMQYYMETRLPKNWLQQIYDEAILSGNRVFANWYPEYKKSLERFQSMFGEGKNAAIVDEDTKDYFIRANQNYISSNTQGMYSNLEYQNILPLWSKMYEIFDRNIRSGTIARKDYDLMNQLMQPALTKKHPAAYHRLWAGLFPQLLTTVITDGRFRATYDKIRQIDPNLPESTGHWLEDNMVLMSYFKEKVSFKDPLHRGLFAWYLYENLNINEISTDMNKYIELLKANYNIVLTGAPGTGKTYLAKKIAAAMGDDNPGFVQFHPSYDYTDFVEGLRPNDDGSFDRVNGVFKQFCAEALSRIKTSDFDKAYDLLLADLAKIDKPMKLTTPNGGAIFAISINKKGNLNLHTGTDFVKQGSLTRESIRSQIGGENIYIYWKGYYDGVIKLLKDKYGLTENSSVTKPVHVFIIDEINRGELSKIFGELFFAIDPGYRGVNGRVKTQYQNLVDSSDPFGKGFYVPDNVFIIGTMNDIDRGVESMDFAIRRRFAWVEVKAEDRVSMLDEKIPEWSEAAKRCMSSINEALKEKGIGLTSAYDLGPAYFLKLDNYDGDFEKLWEYHIKGIVTEYLRGSRDVEEKVAVLKEAYDVYKE